VDVDENEEVEVDEEEDEVEGVDEDEDKGGPSDVSSPFDPGKSPVVSPDKSQDVPSAFATALLPISSALVF
jgi:hypothetical protein